MVEEKIGVRFTKTPIIYICDRKFVGDVFSGKQQFSEVFSKYYGSTPSVVWSEYRNELHET